MTQQVEHPAGSTTPRTRRARRWPVRHTRRAAHATPAVLLGLFLGVLATLAVQTWVLDDPQSEELLPFTPAPLSEDPDVTVTLSNELIAALIQQSVDRGETVVPLTNVRVVSGDGRLFVRGDLRVLGQSVTGEIVLEPTVENGALRMHVRRANLGRLPVPARVERLAEDPINRQLAASTNNLPAIITAALATADGLTVTADVRVEELAAPR